MDKSVNHMYNPVNEYKDKYGIENIKAIEEFYKNKDDELASVTAEIN